MLVHHQPQDIINQSEGGSSSYNNDNTTNNGSNKSGGTTTKKKGGIFKKFGKKNKDKKSTPNSTGNSNSIISKSTNASTSTKFDIDIATHMQGSALIQEITTQVITKTTWKTGKLNGNDKYIIKSREPACFVSFSIFEFNDKAFNVTIVNERLLAEKTMQPKFTHITVPLIPGLLKYPFSLPISPRRIIDPNKKRVTTWELTLVLTIIIVIEVMMQS